MNAGFLDANHGTPAGPTIRVVIADDSRAARESLEGLLETYPEIKVVGRAENGQEAIAQVDDLRPDLVILDLNMPELSGLGAARALRARYPELRIVMISVQDGPIWDTASREAGADEFLAKAALASSFGPVLQRLFGSVGPLKDGRTPESGSESGAPLRVLIVEGRPGNAELILGELRAAGYDPRFELVDDPCTARKALEREPWDLVVSDYLMPGFDPRRALKLLHESGQDIPFILVADAMGEDVAISMMQAGARDCILKRDLWRFVPIVQRELREAEHRHQKRLGEQARERLRTERDELLERLTQQNEDLVALTQTTANAISTLDLDEMLRVLLARVTAVMKADAATILLQEGGLLKVAAKDGTLDMSDAPNVIAVGDGFAGSIAARMEPAYVEDATLDPHTAALTRKRGIRSRLGVPLKHRGVLIGVIHVGWLTARPRRHRELHLLEITAERCAAAVQNARLHHQVRKLSRVVEQAPLSIVITDLSGAIEYVNPTFCAITGYTKEEVQGLNPRILKSGATPNDVHRDLWATLGAGRVWRGELHNRKKNGETHVELAVIAPVLDADGRATHYVALKEDVTREREVEREARESAGLLEQLALHIDEVFWVTDVEKSRMLYVSPAYEAIWGRTCASLLESPLSWLDAVHPDDRERSRQESLADQASGAYDIEYRIVRTDGKLRWIHDRAFPVKNAAGEVYRIVGVAKDVTGQKQAELALIASEKRLRELVDSTPGIVWEADASTLDFVTVSRNAERLLGYPTEEWLAPGFWASHVHPEDRDRAVHACQTSVANSEDHELEYRFVGQDGEVVWLRDIVRIVIENGRPRWLRGLMVDITAARRAQETLQSSLHEKEALLREVHHRVKNNLQVITSLLRLETARSAESKTRSVLTEMQGRIHAMALLHETLYRSGTFAATDLGAYLQRLATQSFRASGARAGAVQLDLKLESVMIEMDQAIPCGLLVNELVSNCLKHAFPEGRAGSVRVDLRAEGSELRLEVSDTGVGLPADFESRRGQGLGLQLVSDLARQLGGRLVVDNGPGTGASFAVTWPVSAPSGR